MCPNLCTYDLPGGGRYPGASPLAGTSRLPYPGLGAMDVERKCLDMEDCVTSVESPCRDCCLVSDPEACDDGNCRLWQRWFLESWNSLRQSVRGQYHQVRLEEVGSIIGGRRYAPPHRREAFLAVDPCLGCRCPKPLCREHCRLRRLWAEGSREVSQ